MAALAAAVVAAVAAGGASASGGAQSQARRIAQLSRQVTHLKAQLRTVTHARDQEKTALASSDAQLAAAQQQVTHLNGLAADLEVEVGSLNGQVSALNGQVTSLQDEIAAIPSPLTVAIDQVSHEVAYEEAMAVPYSHGRLVAQAAMDYVVEHVSASAYGYLEVNNLPLPGPTPDSILGTQAGICGHAAIAFASIVKHLGLRARSAQFYYTDPAGPAGPGTPDSHIAVEVYYDGGWHFFDPTFGVFWTDPATGDVLSITDARDPTLGGVEHKDDISITNLAEDYFYGDSTAFETDPATTVTIGQEAFTG
jgi:hypothetical protein